MGPYTARLQQMLQAVAVKNLTTVCRSHSITTLKTGRGYQVQFIPVRVDKGIKSMQWIVSGDYRIDHVIQHSLDGSRTAIGYRNAKVHGRWLATGFSVDIYGPRGGLISSRHWKIRHKNIQGVPVISELAIPGNDPIWRGVVGWGQRCSFRGWKMTLRQTRVRKAWIAGLALSRSRDRENCHGGGIMPKAVIIMGSKGDVEWSRKISEGLRRFGIDSVLRVASAHKVPLKCHELIKEYEGDNVVFITVAGRSNALSGFTDAQTFCPVIACPPYSDRFGGGDIYSSLRMPSAVGPMVVLEPSNAALAAAKIMGLADKGIQEKIVEYQTSVREALLRDDEEVQDG